MNINENVAINKSPERGKSGGKGPILKYIGGGGWKRISPDPLESERVHKRAASAFKPLIKRKSKSPKKDGKTMSRSPSP